MASVNIIIGSLNHFQDLMNIMYWGNIYLNNYIAEKFIKAGWNERRRLIISIIGSRDYPLSINGRIIGNTTFTPMVFDEVDTPKTILFNECHRKQIIDLVDQFASGIAPVCIFIHCNAGINRSPSVAIGLKKLYPQSKLIHLSDSTQKEIDNGYIPNEHIVSLF